MRARVVSAAPSSAEGAVGRKVETLAMLRMIIDRALDNQPHVMLLDEPTTGLDPQARHVVWDRLYVWRVGGSRRNRYHRGSALVTNGGNWMSSA